MTKVFFFKVDSNGYTLGGQLFIHVYEGRQILFSF